MFTIFHLNSILIEMINFTSFNACSAIPDSLEKIPIWYYACSLASGGGVRLLVTGGKN